MKGRGGQLEPRHEINIKQMFYAVKGAEAVIFGSRRNDSRMLEYFKENLLTPHIQMCYDGIVLMVTIP